MTMPEQHQPNPDNDPADAAPAPTPVPEPVTEPVQANPMADLPQPQWDVIEKGGKPFDDDTVFRYGRDS